MEVTGAPQGFIVRILTFWWGMRASMRGILNAEPGEGRILSFAILSGFLHFLGETARTWLAPETASLAQEELVGRIAAGFVAALLFRTLALYGVAGIAGLICRRAGGQGGWRETRAAVFWASLVAAPLALLAAIAEGVFLRVHLPFAPILSLVGPLAFAFALSACLAEAHRFARISTVFLWVAGIVCGLYFTGYVIASFR